MGSMTVISFLTDGEHAFKDNKEQLANNVIDALSPVTFMEYGENDRSFPVGNYANPMQALRPMHSDFAQVMVAWHNGLYRIGYDSNMKNLEVRKQILKLVKNAVEEEEYMIAKLEKENQNANA